MAGNDFLERADAIDASVERLLDQLDLGRTDEDHQRLIDAIMGATRAADALRAFAHEDLEAAREATTSMGYYAKRALGEAA
jgi:major membrane immunogen (membrane-anchored lipoprotein)